MGFKRPASASRRGQSTRKTPCFTRLSQSASTAFEPQSTWVAINIEFRHRASTGLPRRTTLSLDRGASRAHFQQIAHGRQRFVVETLTVITRGRKNARQALVSPRPGRRLKNKSPLSFNFKCHPQASVFRAFRRVSPLTSSCSRCELQAPEAIQACSIAEQKALRSLPASSAPTLSRVGLVPETRPEAVSPVVQR